MKERHLYLYDGPVKCFGKIREEHYRAGSQAVSPAQAKAFMIFNYKRDNELEKNFKIEFPGEVVLDH